MTDGSRSGLPAPPPHCSNASVLPAWTVERRAAQLVVVPAPTADVGAARPALAAGAGGLLLIGTGAPGDLSRRLETLQSASPGGIRALIMSDEEGGGVQRVANLVGRLPWARTMAATLTAEQVRALGKRTGVALAANGITVDLAPVMDLASGPGPDAAHTDGPRSFSIDPQVAARYGVAFARGLLDGGVLPVVKHFPGEGHATGNTDYGTALTPSIESLQAQDLLPFRGAVGAGLPAVMVGNATVPGLASGPASVSQAVVGGLLRQQLGFNGLVLTDSLSAGALSMAGLDIGSAAVGAISAGADMVLVSSGKPTEIAHAVVSHLVAAVARGNLSTARLDDAVGHVLAAKTVNLCQGQVPATPHG